MNPRHLLPVLLVLTLPGSVMGQEPPNSPIHSDGSCDIEGVVFTGNRHFLLQSILPQQSGQTFNRDWIESDDVIGLFCVDGKIGRAHV